MIRLTTLALLVACGGGAASSGERATAPLEPITRDSAGITIHEHPADALDRAPLITMDSVALAVIGGADEADDITRMFALVFLDNGWTAGFDANRGAVRFFDATGREVASHGRSGQGPAEFGRFNVTVAVAPGDTLVVSDISNGRIALVTETGGVVRVQPAGFRNEGELHGVAGRFAEGPWVMAPSNMLAARSAAEERPPRRAPMAVGRLGDSTPPGGFDTLVMVPGMEMARYKSKFGTREDLVDGIPAFGARTHVTAWDGHAAVATNEHWEVRRYDASGRLVSIVVVRTPLQAVNESVVQAWKEATLSQARERAAQDTVRGVEMMASAEFYLENTARADSVPPFSALHRTAGPVLWLQEYPVSFTDSVRYTAVHSDGRIIGRLTLAPMTRVVGFDADRVAIRTEDDDGIATITIRKLNMP